jgi:molecular chaperone DnaJ
LRARKKGITKRDGKTGDLLVTLQVAVPAKLDDKAREALASYADATSAQDPRSELNALLGAGETTA